MQLLPRHRLEELTESGELGIEPLLDPQNQIGEVSIDLRLGYDFLVSVFTRNPTIDLAEPNVIRKSIGTHFQSTRRDLGDTFVLYPNQVVIGTTLEYISLPNNVSMEVNPRSSYSRLGLHANSFTQPGYRGCSSLELINLGNIPVKLLIGSRILQARFFEHATSSNYHNKYRKYIASVRPIASKADGDEDLFRLRKRRD